MNNVALHRDREICRVVNGKAERICGEQLEKVCGHYNGVTSVGG